MTYLGNLVSVYISCSILTQILTWNYQPLRYLWKRAQLAKLVYISPPQPTP